MALAPGTTLGVYEVTAQIGAGGMGEVYRARDTKLDRDVALKVLPRGVPGRSRSPALTGSGPAEVGDAYQTSEIPYERATSQG